ncbi:uncharacterized protein LOC108221219 [Daucus carota subsp. sativus]|uniref:uncharacterized protein LOC108221219 n=1 Tax=Daucus carota subsp. sativus TaxID=79200 RepID=UPI0030836595
MVLTGLVIPDSLSQENDRLKNDLACAKEIEEYLRNELAENEFKLKAYKNSSQVVQNISEKNTKNNKISIGYDYGRRLGNETISARVGDDTVKPNIFKKEDLLIKQELNDEDEKCDNSIVVENKIVKRPVTVNSSNSQTTRSKNVVNKAETYSFKGIVKRKTKIVTFVPAVKTVEAKDVVKEIGEICRSVLVFDSSGCGGDGDGGGGCGDEGEDDGGGGDAIGGGGGGEREGGGGGGLDSLVVDTVEADMRGGGHEGAADMDGVAA